MTKITYLPPLSLVIRTRAKLLLQNVIEKGDMPNNFTYFDERLPEADLINQIFVPTYESGIAYFFNIDSDNLPDMNDVAFSNFSIDLNKKSIFDIFQDATFSSRRIIVFHDDISLSYFTDFLLFGSNQAGNFLGPAFATLGNNSAI